LILTRRAGNEMEWMEWMEGLGPLITMGLLVAIAVVLMFVARLLFSKENPADPEDRVSPKV
jgi:hypothetical protein